MIDLCITMFEDIKKYKFIVKFEKRKQKKSFELSFDDADFFHLFGMHYLNDIQIKGSAANVYRKIKKDEKLRDKIMKSRDFHLINDRVNAFLQLQTVLNSNFNVYRYVRPHWSDIEAHYALKHRILDNQSFVFLTQRTDSYFVVCSVIKDKREFVIESNRYRTTYKKFVRIE